MKVRPLTLLAVLILLFAVVAAFTPLGRRLRLFYLTSQPSGSGLLTVQGESLDSIAADYARNEGSARNAAGRRLRGWRFLRLINQIEIQQIRYRFDKAGLLRLLGAADAVEDGLDEKGQIKVGALWIYGYVHPDDPNANTVVMLEFNRDETLKLVGWTTWDQFTSPDTPSTLPTTLPVSK